MIRFTNALRAWGTAGFSDALKMDLAQLSGAQLAWLQQGLTTTSYALDTQIEVMIISVSDAGPLIHAKVGVFYSGIIAGCSCADDPTPVEVQREYCEAWLQIDKTTAATTIAPIQESQP